MPDRKDTQRARMRTDRWMADELRDAQRETLAMLLEKEREEREHQLELEHLRHKRWKAGAAVVVILGAIALAGWFGIPVGLNWAGVDLSAGGEAADEAADEATIDE